MVAVVRFVRGYGNLVVVTEIKQVFAVRRAVNHGKGNALFNEPCRYFRRAGNVICKLAFGTEQRFAFVPPRENRALFRRVCNELNRFAVNPDRGSFSQARSAGYGYGIFYKLVPSGEVKRFFRVEFKSFVFFVKGIALIPARKILAYGRRVCGEFYAHAFFNEKNALFRIVEPAVFRGQNVIIHVVGSPYKQNASVSIYAFGKHFNAFVILVLAGGDNRVRVHSHRLFIRDRSVRIMICNVKGFQRDFRPALAGYAFFPRIEVYAEIEIVKRGFVVVRYGNVVQKNALCGF